MPQWDQFEAVDESPSQDWSAYEPVDKTINAKGRRRVELLGKMADVEKDKISSEPWRNLLEWSDTPLISPETMQAAAAIGAPALNSFPGIRQSLAEAGAGLTTPINAAFLASTIGAGSIPKVGGAVVKGIAGGFGANMATEALPGAAEAAGAASVEGTPEEKQKAYADLAITALMSGAALKGATPGARAVPPRIPDVMDASEAAANRSAVNLASPGTVRPSEIARFGPPEVSIDPPAFEAGDVPFDRMKRFGGYELPPVEVLPQSGRLAPIEILDEPRSLLERETRGKTSFGAEAPTLTRTALPIPPEVTAAAEAARDMGLTKSAEAAENAPHPTEAPTLAPDAPVNTPVADVVRSIESLSDEEAGGLKQRPAVEAGIKLTPEDVPALEAARDAAKDRMMAALEAGNDAAFKAEYGKNIWFAGAIEGANKAGPNFDVFTKEAKESNILERVDARLEDLQNNLKGKTFTGVIGLEPVIADLAIAATRAALKATNSVAKAIAAGIDYVRKNHPDAPFDVEKFRSGILSHLEDKPATGAPTPPTTPPVSAPAPAASTPAVPPAPSPPPGTPPPGPRPAPTPAPAASLDDVYKRFEIDPKAKPTIGEKVSHAIEAFRTGFSSKFRPLNKLAEDIAAKHGSDPRDVAAIFEQLKGSSGKAEADVYRFDQEVAKPIAGNEKDFNAYMFLRRSIDRLQQDAATGETRRKVSGYTVPELQAKLALLESNLGPDGVAKFQSAADAYQAQMDQALQLQVTSGRMPLETYEAIKDGNQFYAPFKVMKWLEDTALPEGSGRRVDTMADYTKAMEGIEDSDFKLGDMLSAARQNISLSRILAEKNQAMQHISELSAFDPAGDFIKRLAPSADAPRDMEIVNVLENGEKVRYAVNSDVAQAVQSLGPNSGYLIARVVGGMFRAGATSFNLPFQISNLLADIPRQALVSKYGIKAAADIVRYPMDLVHSLYSAISGDMFGKKNQLFMDFLDSGAAGTTVQQYLTPDNLAFEAGKKSWFKDSLNSVGKLADAIEQTSKILGVKRAMRIEDIGTGKSLATFAPEAITEIRRFSGSPDFGRMGKWTEQYRLNLLYMFLNARIQGTVADVGRLTGRDGAGTAAKTWGKVGVAVGLPTAYLYWLNSTGEYKDDYVKRPDIEKRNYWLIPKDKKITTETGEEIRDYWRIPKREISKWVANTVESGLDFARNRKPDEFAKWGTTMAEELSPINIQGNTAQERLESVGAGLNPMVKAPLEVGTGRDLYRHKAIVPDRMKKASPEQQYTDRTAEVYKTLADKMPDVAPEVFRSPLMLENMTKNFTAGLITQFLPRKPVEGRTALENTPLLQRFQAVPYTESGPFDEKISKYEREAADDQLNRYRTAQKIFDENKNATPTALVKKVVADHGPDEKLAERVVDLYIAHKNGVTPQERRILALPVEQRATYIVKELESKTPAEKTALIRSYASKRILTAGVAEAIVNQGGSLR